VKFKEEFHPFDVVKSVGGINSKFFDLTTLNNINSMLDVKDVVVKLVKDKKNHENKG
jgi:hypothetical protein